MYKYGLSWLALLLSLLFIFIFFVLAIPLSGLTGSYKEFVAVLSANITFAVLVLLTRSYGWKTSLREIVLLSFTGATFFFFYGAVCRKRQL